MTAPPTPPHLGVAYANIEKGGVHLSGGVPSVLDVLLSDLAEPPALMVVCEGRGWGQRAEAITGWMNDRWGSGSRYRMLVGHLERADLPPVLLYDSTRLDLLRWDSPETTQSRHSWNRARFTTMLGDELVVLAQHWEPWDRDARVRAARLAAGLLGGEKHAMVIGDLNSRGSGPEYPEPDWEKRPVHSRHHKAWQPDGPDGPWVSHTAPVDHFTGTWDETRGRRIGGLGWASAAGTDWHQRGRPSELMVQTTHASTERGGGTVIDDALLSPALIPHLVPGSYRVHVPAPDQPVVSDHRLITFALGATV